MNLFKLLGTIAINSKEANAELDGVQKKATATEGSFGKVGKAAGMMGKAIVAGAAIGAVAIAGIGVASLKMAADFDTGMREVNTIAKLSEDELGALKGEVLDVAKEMGIGVPDAVNAVYEALGAGVPPENVVDFLRTASAASIGGATDLTTVVDGLTSTLNAYQLTAQDAGHVSDVMFSTVNYGKLTMDELAGSIANVAPIANAAGVSFEETAAAIAAMTAGGTSASEATTQIRDAISSVLRPTEDLNKVFNDAGYESAGAAIESIGLVNALDLVKKAAGGDVGQLQKLMGTIGGVQATLTLTGAQAGTFNKALDDMQNGSGQAKAAMEEMNKSASRQWAILKSQINVAMVELGSKLLPILTQAAKSLLPIISQAIEAFFDLVDGITATIKDGQALRENFENLSPALQGIAMALANVALFIKDTFIPAFRSGFQVMGPIIAEFVNFVVSNKPILIAAIVAIGVAIALALGPVSLAVAAIIGLIALVGYVRDNWDELAAKAEEIFPGISQFISDAGKVISDVFNAIVDVVKFVSEQIKAHWDEISAVIQFGVDFMVEKIKGGIQFWEGIVAIIKGVIDLVTALFHGDWAAAWQAMKDIAGGLMDAVIGLIKYQFGSIPGIILDLISSAVSAAGDFAAGIVSGFVDGLAGLGDAFIGQVRAGWNKMIAWADNNLKISIGGTNLGPLGSLPSINFDPDFGAFYARATGFRVPFDNFPAMLHRGEEVSSAAEANAEAVSVYIDKVYARDAGEARVAGHDMAWSLRRQGYTG